MNLPMMSDQEIKIMDELLDELKPSFVLEWGAGWSSVYFPNKHPEILRWIAIEHNEIWLDKLKPRLPENSRIVYKSIKDYLKVVDELGVKFDFILIDGLMRAECLMVAMDNLKKGGVVVMHDTGRTELASALKMWPSKAEKLTDGENEIKTFAHRGMHKMTL